MVLEMIGVKFHEARNEIVAFEIFRRRRHPARDHFQNLAVPRHEGAIDHLVRQDDLRVGENSVGHGAAFARGD